MEFKDDWIVVNDRTTHVLSWGTWIEHLKGNQTVILMICGNPGITHFYRDFLDCLYEKVKMPIWAVSHAGHEVPKNLKQLQPNEVNVLYDMENQIEHKKDIIRNYVGESCNVIIIGHSFGAKITVEMMKDESIQSKIIKAYLLFPTVERIAQAPNANFVGPMVKYCASTLVFLSWFFARLFPELFQHFLASSTLKIGYGGGTDSSTKGIVKLVNPDVLRNVFHLVRDEFERINELDVETITKNKHKLKFYYGADDNWSPLKYYENLKSKVEGVDAVVCNEGIEHAFMMKSSHQIADKIHQWISQDLMLDR